MVPSHHLWFCAKNSDFIIRITSLYGSQPSFVAFACKTATLGPEIQVSMGPRPHQCFLHTKERFSTRIASLYVSQTSPVVLSMQKNVINIRITSVYGSQPSSVDFACKTATLGPEIQVSMGPRPHQCFLHSKERFSTRIASLYVSQTSPVVLSMQKNVINIRITSVYGSQPSSVDFACKTATFGQELQVSKGPSLHLRFLHAKHRLLDLIYKSLWVPDFTCWFLNAKQRLLDQNFKSRWCPAIICGFVQKTATLSSELLVSMGPSPHLWILHAKQRL